MHKVNSTTQMVEVVTHEFYCDGCGKHLGTSEEYDDGWYKVIGEFQLAIHMDGWWHLEKHLCDNCQEKFLNNLKTTLENIGFKKSC